MAAIHAYTAPSYVELIAMYCARFGTWVAVQVLSSLSWSCFANSRAARKPVGGPLVGVVAAKSGAVPE